MAQNHKDARRDGLNGKQNSSSDDLPKTPNSRTQLPGFFNDFDVETLRPVMKKLGYTFVSINSSWHRTPRRSNDGDHEMISNLGAPRMQAGVRIG